MPEVRDPDGSDSPSLEILNPAPAAAVTPAVVDSTAAAPASSKEAAAVDNSAKPVEPAAPALETPPADPRTSLLAEFDKKETAKEAEAAPKAEDKPSEPAKDAKPVEGEKKPDAPAEGDKPAEPVVAAEPVAELPKIDYFAGETAIKLPEILVMDDAAKTEFTGALDAFRADPTKGAQGLIDLAGKAFQDYATDLAAKQWQTFNKFNEDGVKAIMADPVLGGAGHDTAMGAVARVRNAIVSDAPVGSERYKREHDEFMTDLAITGAGNRPSIIRAFHNAARFITEAKPVTPDIKPTKENGRQPGQKKLNYDHPTSRTSP